MKFDNINVNTKITNRSDQLKIDKINVKDLLSLMLGYFNVLTYVIDIIEVKRHYFSVQIQCHYFYVTLMYILT